MGGLEAGVSREEGFLREALGMPHKQAQVSDLATLGVVGVVDYFQQRCEGAP